MSKIADRHYRIEVAAKTAAIPAATTAKIERLAADIKDFLAFYEEANTQTEIYGWTTDSVGNAPLVATLKVSANILNDSIIDSAVRLSANALGLVATRQLDG